MSNSNYYLCDVFTQKAFQGNQLSIVQNIFDADKDSVDLAREFGFSETIFLPNGWMDKIENSQVNISCKIFTPSQELPFAGHPLIGLASSMAVLASKKGKVLSTIKLDVPSGLVSVDVKQVNMNTAYCALELPFLPLINDLCVDNSAIAQMVNISESEIDEALGPCAGVTCGSGFAFIPIKSQEALNSIDINRSLWAELLQPTVYQNLYFFYHLGNDEYEVRMFGLGIGQQEDGGTGAAAAGLAYYLFTYQGRDVKGKVHQGGNLGRKSEIGFECCSSENGEIVQISGYSVLIADGSLY